MRSPRMHVVQVTVHKLEVSSDRLRSAAEHEARVTQRAAQPDTYRRQRQRFMTRLRPLLESLNASTRDPPHEWVCHSVASVTQALQRHQQQQQQQQQGQQQQQHSPLNLLPVRFSILVLFFC